ncbi:hypothetical protein [Bradyrhizobium sp. SZCCHNR3118]|uniref:hypothetical protein n=1 Tax=Bradyrhizobium sp. SZCCHNR3118 TaxID=3057468 RepID=UPI0029168057|nr:hypothetical protein [Bradyrhizobium sp. SZCCHNR3118]
MGQRDTRTESPIAVVLPGGMQSHEIEIIELSRLARVVEKFEGAPISRHTYMQAVSEKYAIQSLIMAKMGAATIEEAQAIFVCDQVIAACGCV